MFYLYKKSVYFGFYIGTYLLIDNSKIVFLDSWQNGSAGNIVFDILKCLQFIEGSSEKRI